MLTTEVKDDLYFSTSSLTYSYPTMPEMDDNNTTLMLGRTRGDDLTSLLPPTLLTPTKAEREIIIVTRIDSPAVAKGYTLLRGREVAPPVQCKVLTFSDEDDLLSETPRQVSSNEGPPIEMASRSLMGC